MTLRGWLTLSSFSTWLATILTRLARNRKTNMRISALLDKIHAHIDTLDRELKSAPENQKAVLVERIEKAQDRLEKYLQKLEEAESKEDLVTAVDLGLLTTGYTAIQTFVKDTAQAIA